MTAEYSYFLAAGLSLEALETVRESQAELKQLQKKLCDKFGADDFMGGYLEDLGQFQLIAFHFRAGQKVPEDWKIINEQRFQNGALMGTFAKPLPGSPDEFHVANIGGLMERASRFADLEGVFGVKRYMHEHPPGMFETSFVRQSYMKGGPEPVGKIYGPNIAMGGSSSSGRAADPICAMELDGKAYIRVPNKPGTQEPMVTPPDAIPVSYEKMIEADKAEMNRRSPPRDPYDMSWGC